MSSSLICTLDSPGNWSLSEFSSGMKFALELAPVVQSIGAETVHGGSGELHPPKVLLVTVH